MNHPTFTVDLTRLPISDKPYFFYTHFTQLTKRDKKGSSKYQCRTCDHSFICCGKRRLINHILGDDHPHERIKNVIKCTNPYLPLKQSLIESLRKDPSGRELTSYATIAMLSKEMNNFYDIDPFIEGLLAELDDPIAAPPSTGNSPETPHHQHYNQFQPSFFETPNYNFYGIAGGGNMIENSFYHHNQFAQLPSSPILPTINRESPDTKIVDLNRAIIKFFSSYGIPLTEVDSISFQTLLNGVHQTPPDPHFP